MNSIGIVKAFFSVAVLPALSLLVVSCGGTSKVEPLVTPGLVIKTRTVAGDAGSQFMSVTAGGSWTLSVSEEWLSVNPSSGTGSSDMVVLSYKENSGAVRTATVTLTCTNGTAAASLTQNKRMGTEPSPGENGYGAATATASWMELPRTSEDDGFEFFTHNMSIGTTKTRNYSYYWDYDNLVATWVAYPLCTWNIGNGKRTDAWGIDPLLPESRQPVLFSPFSGFGDRGHQIPSADRLTYSANVQTFYGTNMTPQNHNLNGGVWANLEEQVRVWARKTGAQDGTDTLYVLTGCVVGKSTRKSYDNMGKAVTVPEGYFKALLRYKEGTGHGGFTGCAFYFDNEDKYGQTIRKDMSMSIASLEGKLGYGLFVNLEAKVGAETAKLIKSEDPSTVPWWW